jgi:ParB family chromosome partitioning protein
MGKPHTKITPPPDSELMMLALDLIDDPETPIRQDLSPESVADLVQSIRQVGLIEPIVVKHVGDRYEVIAGHRRLIASKIADLAKVPTYVVAADANKTELWKMHENLYRTDVKPTDEAEYFKYLIDTHELSPTKIAQLINRSESYVSDRLAIFNYAPELRLALDKKQITFSVAREFNRLSDVDKLREYLHYAIINGITHRLAHQWVKDYERMIAERENPTVAPYQPSTAGAVVEAVSTCVFCHQAIKLSEANVVYIHDACLQAAKQIAVDDEPQPPADITPPPNTA